MSGLKIEVVVGASVEGDVQKGTGLLGLDQWQKRADGVNEFIAFSLVAQQGVNGQ